MLGIRGAEERSLHLSAETEDDLPTPQQHIIRGLAPEKRTVSLSAGSRGRVRVLIKETEQVSISFDFSSPLWLDMTKALHVLYTASALQSSVVRLNSLFVLSQPDELRSNNVESDKKHAVFLRE